MTRTTLEIDGMTCGHCVAAVRKALQSLDGVEVEQVAIVVSDRLRAARAYAGRDVRCARKKYQFTQPIAAMPPRIAAHSVPVMPFMSRLLNGAPNGAARQRGSVATTE